MLLKRPGRGALIAASVTSMYLLGLMMRGALFSPQTGDLLTTVIYCGGFVGNLLSGILYFLTRVAGLRAAGYGRARPRLRHEVPGRGGVAEPAGDGGRLRNRDTQKGLGRKDEVPKVNLSHFEASVLFALLTSVVLGIVTKRTDRERFRYAAYCFACFLGALFGLSWLMYLGHG